MKVQKLTQKEMEAELSLNEAHDAKEERIVVIDFYADWCGPCKMLSLVYEEVARQTAGVFFGKVNIDEEAEAARRYGVRTIPTILAFRGGIPVATLHGFVRKAELLAFVAQARESVPNAKNPSLQIKENMV